jgi:hypothetical protein
MSTGETNKYNARMRENARRQTHDREYGNAEEGAPPSFFGIDRKKKICLRNKYYVGAPKSLV